MFRFLLFASALLAQQKPDLAFEPRVAKPRHARGAGPVVVLDEAHNNFHTAKGRFGPFAQLAEKDGYVVRSGTAAFTAESLASARVLVIANALHARNVNHWQLPTPSAFKSAEIKSVVEWVQGGGSLLLIADHMPFAGAAQGLGHALGVKFSNGYVRREPRGEAPDMFAPGAGLGTHDVTKGIASVATFTGSAFRAPEAQPLLTLGPNYISLLPDKAADFKPDTPRESVAGWLQGGLLRVGKGRVAVFGEAAMFSAQISANGSKMGMNHPKAGSNGQFVLNVLRWLSE